MLSLQLNKLIIANSFFKKLRGLYFYSKNTCVLFFPCKSIHTIFFFRKVDVAFINKEKIVVKVVEKLKPFSVAYCNSAYYVFEKYSSNKIDWFSEGDIINYL